MIKLRKTTVFKSVSKPTQVSILGVSTTVASVLLMAVFFLMVFIHDWRLWLACFPLIVVAWLAALTITRKDHNAFRRLKQAYFTKWLSSDADIWGGASVSSLPHVKSKEPRGIF